MENKWLELVLLNATQTEKSKDQFPRLVSRCQIFVEEVYVENRGHFGFCVVAVEKSWSDKIPFQVNSLKESTEVFHTHNMAEAVELIASLSKIWRHKYKDYDIS